MAPDGGIDWRDNRLLQHAVRRPEVYRAPRGTPVARLPVRPSLNR